MSIRALLLSSLLASAPLLAATGGYGVVTQDMVKNVSDQLIETHGAAQADRIRMGVAQAAARWSKEDGDAEQFATFCEKNFLADPKEVTATFDRLAFVLEQTDGRLHEIRRMLMTPQDLDTGTVSRIDRYLGDLDLQSHVDDDLFGSKAAFVALLNFPVHTLQQRLTQGPKWTREQWARSRMMDRFDRRLPAEVSQQITRAYNAADDYISNYNIHMDMLTTKSIVTPWKEEKDLITHWGLRDELGSLYGQPQGLEKQRIIYKVMERIVRQEIPAVMIDGDDFYWNPETNELKPRHADEYPKDIAIPEADIRYERLLDIYRAVREADPYSPTASTFIARRFEIDRQIPEAEVEALLDRVLSSQEVQDLARRIPAILGRPLEPFDIWYSGFKPRGGRSESELDAIVKQKYPTVKAFQTALPTVLTGLGFTPEKSKWLADRIVVDPSRGAGHAMGAVRREDVAHLRTRVGSDGMNYKGYNIAIHELGHNVEQIFSLNGIDSWFLAGVPNNAFTEAFAFTFQERDMELLGLAKEASQARRDQALATLWATYEIGGVGIVDMKVWRFLYQNPNATPAELKAAVLRIAREVWNKYYAPVFGTRDQEILAIYSHMIEYGLYLPDYSLGHIIAFQVAEKLRAGNFGTEFERMAKQGRLTPDAWMRGAVGGPLSAEPLLAAAREALAAPR